MPGSLFAGIGGIGIGGRGVSPGSPAVMPWTKCSSSSAFASSSVLVIGSDTRPREGRRRITGTSSVISLRAARGRVVGSKAGAAGVAGEVLDDTTVPSIVAADRVATGAGLTTARRTSAMVGSCDSGSGAGGVLGAGGGGVAFSRRGAGAAGGGASSSCASA